MKNRFSEIWCLNIQMIRYLTKNALIFRSFQNINTTLHESRFKLLVSCCWHIRFECFYGGNLGYLSLSENTVNRQKKKKPSIIFMFLWIKCCMTYSLNDSWTQASVTQRYRHESSSVGFTWRCLNMQMRHYMTPLMWNLKKQTLK